MVTMVLLSKSSSLILVSEVPEHLSFHCVGKRVTSPAQIQGMGKYTLPFHGRKSEET